MQPQRSMLLNSSIRIDLLIEAIQILNQVETFYAPKSEYNFAQHLRADRLKTVKLHQQNHVSFLKDNIIESLKIEKCRDVFETRDNNTLTLSALKKLSLEV